jgi:hypothetical protein
VTVAGFIVFEPTGQYMLRELSVVKRDHYAAWDGALRKVGFHVEIEA